MTKVFRTYVDEMNENLRELTVNHPEYKKLYVEGNQVLKERFLEKENPSFVFNDYLTEITAMVTDMEMAYAHTGANRNSLDELVLPLMKRVLDSTATAMKAMRYAPPEDTNG